MFDVQAEPGYNEQANSLDTVRYITQLRLNKIAYHETFYNEFTMYRFITKDTWIPQKSKLDNVGSNFFLCLAAIHPVTNIGVLDTQDRAGLLHPQLVSAEYQYSASTAESAREKNIAKRKAPWTLHSWCWHNEFNNQNFSTLSGSYFTWVTKFQEFNIKKKKKKDFIQVQLYFKEDGTKSRSNQTFWAEEVHKCNKKQQLYSGAWTTNETPHPYAAQEMGESGVKALLGLVAWD